MTIAANRATSAPVATGTASTARRRQLMGPLVMGPLGLSIGITLILVFTSSATETRLGAPLYWSWLLTGLQVVALWAAGAEHRWGWLLGASVQPPWIVYAVLTDQVGFIPGCAISAAVQICSFVRGDIPESLVDATPGRQRRRPVTRQEVIKRDRNSQGDPPM